MIDLSRRSLLRVALATPFAASLVSLAEEAAYAQDKPDVGTGPFTLPPLPYKFNALEPHIDSRTMQIHHDKHHATYIKNLNEAVTKNPGLQGKTPEELLKSLDSIPEAARMTVRNNAGGHINHTMFWTIMKPRGGGQPNGAVADAIKGTFGSLDNFQTRFNEAGAKRFGSGWVWLVRTADGNLDIVSTPNQDSPILDGNYPIMGNDVWEHAYYLKYQNKRPDYLKAWWNTVNWEVINQRLVDASRV